MIRYFITLLLFPLLALADDKWLEFRSGPFVVLTAAGEKPGRETLNQLEQLRYVLGNLLGKQELQSVWPIRLVVEKPKQASEQPRLRMGRDAWMASVSALRNETQADIVRVLIQSNAGVLPEAIELGLIELLSTLTVDGTKLTLGVPPAAKTRDWSRIHMLTVDPAYSGKLRVLIGNFQNGVDPEPAYKNAFEKTPAQIEEAVNKYIEAGKYESIPYSGKPLDPKRQLIPKVPEPLAGPLALADVKFATDPKAGEAAYRDLLNRSGNAPEPHEGLGLAYLAQGQKDAARSELQAAVKNGSKNANAWLALARIETDDLAHRADAAKAAELNPRWSDPPAEMASVETEPLRKVPLLKKAAELDRRVSARWVVLAETQDAAKQYAEAQKSWGMAERSATTPQLRAEMRAARTAGETKRLDQAAAQKAEERRKAAQELEDLRNKSLAEIRAFEARANAGQAPRDPNEKLAEYHEEVPSKIFGMLTRVDCLGKQARLVIQDESGHTTRILVPDPSKVMITGGGEHGFSCGLQKPSRSIGVEYTARGDKKLGTVGDASVVTFR